MDRPLEIAFHNLQASESVEAEIRKQMDRLEARHARIIGGRVSVEALHQQHQTGNLFEVHVTISLPGHEIAVSREPHHARERRAHPDVHSAVKEAFRAADKRLESLTTRQRSTNREPASDFRQ